MAADEREIVIEMWTDVGCPFCYVGKHRLETAIAQRPDGDRFRVELRSFELAPDASHEPEPIAEAFARKNHTTPEVFTRMEGQVQAMANSEGLEFTLDRPTANTFDVHRVLRYATEQGRGVKFYSRVQDGYFAGSLNPFDTEQLVAAAEAAGLPGDRVRQILASDEYAEAVRADEAESQQLGVRGVPFTVFDRRFAASGAQSVEGYAAALTEAVPLPVQSGEAR